MVATDTVLGSSPKDFFEVCMTFNLTLEEAADTELNVLLNPDESLARIPIGFDDETQDVYGVLVALVPMPGMGPVHRELMFFLYRAKVDGDGEIEQWNDGLETKSFLNDADRALVLAAICVAAKTLVEETKPHTISMTTVKVDLPARALIKYETVCDAIVTLSYEYGQVDPYLGTRQWLMTRISN